MAGVRRLDALILRWWFLDALVLFITLGIVGAAVLLTPSTEAVSIFGFEVPVLCNWRRLTGLYCPGCGMTRSFTFMAHGYVRTAFNLNVLGPPGFVVVAVQIPWRLLKLWTGTRRGRRRD